MRLPLPATPLLHLAVLAAWVAFCVVTGASGAELRLKNGDVLRGELIRRDDSKIYFRSETLGEIAVPSKEAVVVDTPETPVESLAGLPPGAPLAPREGSDSGTSQKPGQRRWEGQLEFGFQQQTGRQDALSTSFRATAERAFLKNDLRTEARALYGEQDEVTNTDRFDALFRWRHELSPKTFAQSQTSFTKDRVRGIRQNYEENLGFGVRLWESLRTSANIGAGITGQYREASGVESGIGYLGEAFQDFTYRLSGRLTFLQSSSLLTSLRQRGRQVETTDSLERRTEQGHDYRIRFSTTLQGRVTNRVSLNLRFEYEFDSAIERASARADKRITSSIGYGF